MHISTPAARESVIAMMRRIRALPDGEYLQSLIAYHAAPTLLGIKPATLICPDSIGRNLDEALKNCVPCLVRIFGVEVASFRNRAGALLILVYSPRLLRSVLARREVSDLLAETGYDAKGVELEGVLATLGTKCAGQCFPHEIGVFLGYPPEDVRCFMNAGHGRGCRNGGCWKSYGDVRRAKRRSERFGRLRLKAAELLVGGADLAEVAEGLRTEAA